MEFKGTPAPWFWEDSVLCNKDFIVGGYGYNFYNQANKNLIAAAPELLESLRELVSAMEKYEMDVDEIAPVKHREIMKKARAAIAKALGQQ
ncbi:TPA: hypothetical protein U2M43_001076 [Providencia stuartii]|nr:hypothetical protein [Providencia stuartii]